MQEVKCDYCGQLAEYVDSECVYKRSYGMIYRCAPCDAWVGVHEGTDKPKGRLANAELREWKIKAHAAFDPLWHSKMTTLARQGVKRSKGKARGAAYAWLAKELSVPVEACHIGMFDVSLCQRVIELCRPWSDPIRNRPWYDGVRA